MTAEDLYACLTTQERARMIEERKKFAMELAIRSSFVLNWDHALQAASQYHWFLSQDAEFAMTVRQAAIIFRNPEVFEIFFAALEVPDSPENREKIDTAFKNVMRVVISTGENKA
jgi:hypothetical protein